MKALPLFVPLLAVVATPLWFHSPAPTLGAQDRGQAVRKTDAEPRIALVIGNGAYAEAPLANPVNDARDMSATLSQLGFEVLSGENRNLRQMEDLAREFGRKIRGGGVGMFYFAGHGAQVGGANYLIPIGAKINGEAEVKYEAVDAGFVLAQMEEARNRLNIVVLDACRNNPFARSFRSSSRGLASIDAPVGTLIAYATAPGRTAGDGAGRNGLYTKELLAAMRSPDLKLEDVFKRVRSEVRRQSNNQQIPWEASSIEGDFYFSTTSIPAPTTLTPVIALPRGIDPSRLAVHNFTTASVDARGNVSKFAGAPTQRYTEDLGNGVRLEMVSVRGGTFTMGGGKMDREKPSHQVTVGDFWFGKFEVTQAQWRAVMGTNPSKFNGDDLPVENVSWEYAKEFCRRLNAKLGLSEAEGYRLPTEAEWEYAARAGSKTNFSFGDTITPEIVNYNGNYPYGGAPKGVYRQKTVAVGSLGVANAWGLFDLQGNVQEWCEDDFHGSYIGAPADGRAWVDISNRALLRVIRGGSWDWSAVYSRSAYRKYTLSAYSGYDVGFRLSRTAQ